MSRYTKKFDALHAAAKACEGWSWPDRKRDEHGTHYFGQRCEGEFYEIGTIDASTYTENYADDIRVLKFIRAAQPKTILALFAEIAELRAALAATPPQPAPQPGDLQGAALSWWKSKRPLAYSLEKHLQSPTVNCSSADESELARVVANLVAASGAGSPASVQQDRQDAERYRWLRNPETDVALVLDKRTGYVPDDESVPGVGGYHIYEYRAGEELDAAIDAALAARKEQKP